jgi:hypothetical protein
MVGRLVMCAFDRLLARVGVFFVEDPKAGASSRAERAVAVTW